MNEFADDLFTDIASTLIDIEAELRRIGQWDAKPPAPSALASTEPFCVDTLSLAQWLQFIFIPRMHALVSNSQLPPGRCEILPIAEEYFRNSKLAVSPLLQHIGQLDALINQTK